MTSDRNANTKTILAQLPEKKASDASASKFRDIVLTGGVKLSGYEECFNVPPIHPFFTSREVSKPLFLRNGKIIILFGGTLQLWDEKGNHLKSKSIWGDKGEDVLKLDSNPLPELVEIPSSNSIVIRGHIHGKPAEDGAIIWDYEKNTLKTGNPNLAESRQLIPAPNKEFYVIKGQRFSHMDENFNLIKAVCPFLCDVTSLSLDQSMLYTVYSFGTGKLFPVVVKYKPVTREIEEFCSLPISLEKGERLRNFFELSNNRLLFLFSNEQDIYFIGIANTQKDLRDQPRKILCESKPKEPLYMEISADRQYLLVKSSRYQVLEIETGTVFNIKHASCKISRATWVGNDLTVYAEGQVTRWTPPRSRFSMSDKIDQFLKEAKENIDYRVEYGVRFWEESKAKQNRSEEVAAASNRISPVRVS